MKETMPQVDIFCHQVKPLWMGMSYILLTCWQRGHYGTLQASQAIPKAIDDNVPFLKTTLTCVIEYGEDKLIPN